jgi:hypothetical protein
LAAIETAGARLVNGSTYVSAQSAVELVCQSGHAISARPAQVLESPDSWQCKLCYFDGLKAESKARLIERLAASDSHMVDEDSYQDVKASVAIVCGLGHHSTVIPSNVVRPNAKFACRKCAYLGSRRAADSKQRFEQILESAGARLADDAEYVDRLAPIRIICVKGHHRSVRPHLVIQGIGVCKICTLQARKNCGPRTTRRTLNEIEVDFAAMLASFDREMVDARTLASPNAPVAISCHAGHISHVRPSAYSKKGGACIVCTREATKQNTKTLFLERVRDLGWRVADDGLYVDIDTPVSVVCGNGHALNAKPSNVFSGSSCGACVRERRIAETKTRFLRRLEDLGAQMANVADYVNATTSVDVVCQRQHSGSTVPGDVLNGAGICARCGRRERSKSCEARFLSLLEKYGSRLTDSAQYSGSGVNVAVICRNGHESMVRPNSVNSGGGVCALCTVEFDRVYLIVHEESGAIKVGIASGEGRWATHRRNDYRQFAEWGDLTHDTARSTETAILEFWEDQGWPLIEEAPLDGRTETASLQHLRATHARLVEVLGQPSILTVPEQLTAAA